METESKWIDAAWWRDWLFWVGVVGGGALFVYRLGRGNGPWWWDAFGGLLGFAITVAAVGFFRTVIRTYRAPEVDHKPNSQEN